MARASEPGRKLNFVKGLRLAILYRGEMARFF
jgi:hypothetical protein